MKNAKEFIILLGSIVFFTTCNSPLKNVQKADQCLQRGEFDEALFYYKKAYSTISTKERKEKANIAFRMGIAYEKLRQPERALVYFKNAQRYQSNDSTLWYHLGNVQLQTGKISDAEKTFITYLEKLPTNQEALLGLQSIQTILKNQQNQLYNIELASIFSSQRSDFSPSLTGSQYDQLYFTSSRKEARGNNISPITGTKYCDIFMSQKNEKGEWKKPVNIQNLNTDYDEGITAFSTDGKTLFLTQCLWNSNKPSLLRILKSTRSDASWSKPQPIQISKDTLSSFAHPAISPDGKYLYFTSDMPGGMGGFDLWRIKITSNGFIGLENLGPTINTKGNEVFPTFKPTGELYFSSDGHIGFGGLDIYEAKFKSDSSHWKITHLPMPINSFNDDFSMTFEGVKQKGFFSSNRNNPKGWDKIYSFQFQEVEQIIKGWVYEQDGYELPQAQIYIVGNDGTNEVLNVKMDGSFEFLIHPKVKYTLLATCPGFLNHQETLQVDSVKKSTEYTLQFPLSSMRNPVIVRNVFYDFNRANLTDSTQRSLNQLANLLKENPRIVIELSSHTDNRGSETYNHILSQKRAESVVMYLIEKGITPERLKAKGYGESQPMIISKKMAEKIPFLHENDTLTPSFINKLPVEQQDFCHALNRRTAFQVIRTN